MPARRPSLRVLSRVVGLALTVLLVTGVLSAQPAGAVESTTLTAHGSAAFAGRSSTFTLRLTSTTGPVAGVPLVVERRSDGAWARVATVVTAADGRATLGSVLRKEPRDNLYRVGFAGDPTYAPATAETTPRLLKRAGRIRIGGPGKVVDERSVRLRITWRAGAGGPVAGTVVVLSREPRGRWRQTGRVETNRRGTAFLRVRPRTDTQWKVRGVGQAWVRGARSRVHRIDNLPPRRPVHLPGPRPRVRVPVQPSAIGSGANPVVTRIPDDVWSEMTGRTWHAGCPVGRDGLRLVRINYWGYDGYRHRGEVVANAGAAGRMAAALGEMYAKGFPIRSMYRVDRFGWSGRLGGGDDYASMAAGNTSAFNCRNVVGRPGVRSPHSYGRSLDVNPWENPYRSQQGVVPNSFWLSRSHPLVAWRSAGHPVVRIMARHGLRWTYGHGDLHHFDAVGGRGRTVALADLPALLHPQCEGFVCE